MTKDKKEEPKGLANVEQTLTSTEQFLEENYKPILISLGIIVVIIGLGWLGKLYLDKRNDEALSQMYMAEKYLEMDSLKLALNGDGNYLGFLDIVSDYKFTASGNLAKYYSGICYLHLGDFENAINYLQKYSKKDKVIGSLALGATGDAYIEQGNTEKGIKYYLEAADYADNLFNTPLFLMKAAEIYELGNRYQDALDLYEKIQKDYPESTEAASMDKYIARVKVLMKSAS
jgi:tetratricopeptide (TPR) repeat protein